MTSINEVYELFLKSNGVQTDSRILKDGELFFALKGKNFDGNLFVKQAIRAKEKKDRRNRIEKDRTKNT
jgi:UDP-N-acetylmuramoyl-tripeptide--D-alanyl-D-alanine ligase